MRITLIDNYDSFTYNLVHYLEENNVDVLVMKNDEINWDVLDKTDGIILSPGPGLPNESGDLMKVIQKYHSNKPILGVCLGMQALATFFGDSLENQEEVKHGVTEKIHVKSYSPIYYEIESPTEVGLYHSWKIILQEKSPFFATALSENEVLMSFQHNTLPLFGVQFHPESIMTKEGKKMLQNFIAVIG